MSFENNGSEDAIVDEGRQFIVAAYSRPGDVFYAAVKAIENKQEELKLKYPDCHNYRLYNILIGRTRSSVQV